MVIELVKDVPVRCGQAFVTVKAGTKVNYNSEKREPGHMLHRFTFMIGGRILEHLCVTPRSDKPEWL